MAGLEGKIRQKNDPNRPFEPASRPVAEFHGRVPVESWGQCVDFNLMVRKGKGLGAVAVLSGDCEESWDPGPGDLAVYCASGKVRFPEWGLEAGAGQLLLCRGARGGAVRLVCEAGAVMLASVREA